MISLNNQVVLITGASRGIGAAAALKFADAGASVVVNYNRSEADATRIVAEARSRGVRAIAVQADVSRRQDVEHLFERTLSELGRLDVLVANAGIWKRGP
ncbi:MAG TPA: SDR family NAD(P)-dependent oxidoreductase, partial [Blastocatellia bacterium]|nr:SDR family NAD(P)-dependent oxidoreductase [Blastocatellia bacterium]